jgi:NitT/TauT family transport system substrate-binding protein
MMSNILQFNRPSPWTCVAAVAACLTTFAVSGDATAQTAAKELTPVSLRLGFIAGAWDVGEYVARDLGYYKDAGLAVTITEGQGSNSNIQLLSAGQVDFAKVAAASLIPGVGNGAKLKMIACHIQIQGAGVATKPEIKTVKDMSGKTYVGVTFDFATQLFPAYVQATGITNVKVVMAAPEAIPQVLVAGKADLMTANAWAEVPQLENLHAKFNFFPYSDYGVDPLGIGIVTTDAMLEKKPELAKAFATATMRGWQYVYDHPEEAAKIFTKAVPSVDLDLATTTAKLMEPLSHTPASKGHPLGWMAEQDWVQSITLLSKFDLVKVKVEPKQLYVNLIAEH